MPILRRHSLMGASDMLYISVLFASISCRRDHLAGEFGTELVVLHQTIGAPRGRNATPGAGSNAGPERAMMVRTPASTIIQALQCTNPALAFPAFPDR